MNVGRKNDDRFGKSYQKNGQKEFLGANAVLLLLHLLF